MTKKIYKFATGQDIPDNAEYICTIKNGVMNDKDGYQYVWHYFIVECED